MRMKVLGAFCAGLLSSGSPVAFAQATPLRIPYQNMTARAAYLGGAFTAVANDQNALFFNPAGLAYLDSTFVALADLEIKASLGSGGIGSIMDDLSKSSTIAQQIGKETELSARVDKAVELGEFLASRTLYSGLRWQACFARKSWGFAITPSMDLGLALHSKLLPETLDFGLVVDADLRGGYARLFFDEKLSVGVAPYYKLRSQAGQAGLSLNDAFSSTFLADQIAIGQGFGADLGMMIRPVKAMEPTFGLAILNIGDTQFYGAPEAVKSMLGNKLSSNKNSERKPDPIKQVVNAGFSMTPITGRAFVQVSGELREINRPTAAEYKPALGVEGGFRSSFLRALAGVGWGNGGWSAGAELRAFLKMRFATYIEPNLFFDRLSSQRVWIVSVGF